MTRPQEDEEKFRRMRYEKFQRLVELGITGENPLDQKEEEETQDKGDETEKDS
jgi:hypothetical protein